MSSGLGRLGYLRLGSGGEPFYVVPVAEPVATTPLAVFMGGVDVTHRITSGSLSWEAAINRTPTAAFTLHDPENPSGGLPTPIAVAYQDGYAYPVVKVINEGNPLFLGPPNDYQRENPHEGMQTPVSAEGWQGLMSECPCWPNSWTSTQEIDPEAKTWVFGEPSASPYPVIAKYGDGGRAIERAIVWWRGPAITLDCPDTLTSVAEWSVRGTDLASVIDGILERCGGGIWWLDASMVLHVRSVPDGVGGGEATYTGPEGLLADWTISDTPGTGVLVPTSVSESNSRRRAVSGVYADGKTARSSRYVTSGAVWSGATQLTIESARGSIVEEYAHQGLKAPGWDRTVSAVIPPLASFDTLPEIGVVVHLDYMAWNGYYLVRGITTNTVVTGDTLEVAQWTLDLGSAPPRSYVREAPKDPIIPEVEGPVYTKQVVSIEVSPVDQNMGTGSRQYIYAWAVDGDRKRVAMDAGTVTWSILTEDGTDIGAGSEEAGWVLTTTTSDVVYTTTQPDGFASTELTCYDTDTYPMVRVQATMDLPE
jgi:hypothetical protein